MIGLLRWKLDTECVRTREAIRGRRMAAPLLIIGGRPEWNLVRSDSDREEHVS